MSKQSEKKNCHIFVRGATVNTSVFLPPLNRTSLSIMFDSPTRSKYKLFSVYTTNTDQQVVIN
jgi:hypothetical protein